MTNGTMIAPGGFFFLKGDPLGVRAWEEKLAWQSDGPLPEWLDGADPDEEAEPSVEERMGAATLMLPSIPAPPSTFVAPSPTEPADNIPTTATDEHEPSETPSETPSCDDVVAFEDCVPIEEIPPVVSRPEMTSANSEPRIQVRDVDEPTALITPAIGSDLGTRRRVSVDELNDASYCFVAEAAGVLWAVSLDRISYVSRKSRANNTIDLRSGQRSTSRDGVAVTLFSDVAIRFDRSLGPRAVRWSPLPPSSDAPRSAIARAVISGETLLLFDAQSAVK